MRKTMIGISISALLLAAGLLFYHLSALQEPDRRRLVYITPSLEEGFWRAALKGMQSTAESTGGVSLEVFDSGINTAKQLEHARTAVEKKIDGIILSPVDTVSCSDVLTIAEAAGIPVVICDIGTETGEYVSYISSNNLGGANAVGGYMSSVLYSEKRAGNSVVIIAISQDRYNGQQRTAGFQDALQGSGLIIQNIVECQYYSVEEALRLVRQSVQKYPDLTGIFAEYTGASIAAVEVLRQAGKTEDVLIVGFDGSPEEYRLLKEGSLAAVSMQQPVRMGRIALETMVKHLAGEDVETEIEVPTILVTRENAFEVEPQIRDNVFSE